MSSTKPLPSIQDHLDAFFGAIKGIKDRYADKRRGAIYEAFGAAGAILWTRAAERDQEMFRSTYFDTATGDALTEYVLQRDQIDRVLDTRGVGSATLMRDAAGAATTIYKGTRIRVSDARAVSRVYEVAADEDVAANVTFARVSVRASQPGYGWSIDETAGISIEDSLDNTTWRVSRLSCSDGTVFEEAAAFRARVREQRLLNRNGHESSIIDACRSAGAAYAILFESYWGQDLDSVTNDFGINACYVADQSYSGSSTLVKACHVAIEHRRVLGATMYVGGITASRLPITATVTLRGGPGKHNLVMLERVIRQSVASEFTGTRSGFAYKLDEIKAMIAAPVADAVTAVSLTAPTANVTISTLNWPATLTRYFVEERDVNVKFI